VPGVSQAVLNVSAYTRLPSGLITAGLTLGWIDVVVAIMVAKLHSSAAGAVDVVEVMPRTLLGRSHLCDKKW